MAFSNLVDFARSNLKSTKTTSKQTLRLRSAHSCLSHPISLL